MLRLFEIENRVNELAQKINAPLNISPTYGYSEQTSRPHVEASQWAYYYVAAQSGQEVSRYTKLDIDQLLYRFLPTLLFNFPLYMHRKIRLRIKIFEEWHFSAR